MKMRLEVSFLLLRVFIYLAHTPKCVRMGVYSMAHPAPPLGRVKKILDRFSVLSLLGGGVSLLGYIYLPAGFSIWWGVSVILFSLAIFVARLLTPDSGETPEDWPLRALAWVVIVAAIVGAVVTKAATYDKDYLHPFCYAMLQVNLDGDHTQARLAMLAATKAPCSSVTINFTKSSQDFETSAKSEQDTFEPMVYPDLVLATKIVFKPEPGIYGVMIATQNDVYAESIELRPGGISYFPFDQLINVTRRSDGKKMVINSKVVD
jgi:hypothetical protein